MDKCLCNLADLCSEIAINVEYIEIVDNADFFYCRNLRDIWPNYFIAKKAIFETQLIKDLLKSEINQPLILAPYATLNDISMRSNGFFPMESWINMGKELILGQPQNELLLNVSVEYVKMESEAVSWINLVNLNLFRNLLTTNLLVSNLNNKKFKYFLAKVDDHIVGTAMVYCDYNDKSAGIYMLSVSQDFRNKKIGSAILSSLELVLINEGFQYVYLQSTRMGIHLYEKFGFQKFEKYILYKLIKKNE